jgi:hypothetical protein
MLNGNFRFEFHFDTMETDPCVLWPRSSLSFTEMQLYIWNLKVQQATFPQIQEELFYLMNEAAEDGVHVNAISTSCLYSCIRRTAMGRSWDAHTNEGRPRFLNADEEVFLSNLIAERCDLVTLEDCLSLAVEVRQRTLMMLEPILSITISCPGIVRGL